MKLAGIKVITVALMLSFFTACSSDSSTNFNSELSNIQPLPDGVAFIEPVEKTTKAPHGNLLMTNGEEISLQQLWSDRPVVMIFLEPWCQECAEGQEIVNTVVEKYGEVIHFVGVTSESNVEQISEYVSDHQIKHPVLQDLQGDVLDSYAVDEAPATVFISQGGVLLRGWQEIFPEIEEAIDALLVESLPDTSRGQEN